MSSIMTSQDDNKDNDNAVINQDDNNHDHITYASHAHES